MVLFECIKCRSKSDSVRLTKVIRFFFFSEAKEIKMSEKLMLLVCLGILDLKKKYAGVKSGKKM